MNKPHEVKTWVVVADAGKARFLVRQGVGKKLVPASVGDVVHANPPTREQGTDRPGRTHESAGGGAMGMRHAMEPRVDWHKFEKSKFAHEVAMIINDAALAKSFDRLVLIAPPETLGNLRADLNKAAQATVSLEIDRDLTNFDTQEIAQYLSDFFERGAQETD